MAGMTGDFQADVEAIPRIDAVPRILDVICRTMGEGFARRSLSRTAMNSSRAPAADQSQSPPETCFLNAAALSDRAKALVLLNKSPGRNKV
ncbi:hypothetical protein AB8A31_01870 [Tardiphaga sp. 804_B3_N1_9]|uniref:hypothetical protein n=1 Tax=Tardiphaga TaxID=1395974 RepID=UPI001585FA34|nr:hypothetical protein [Tardiphaga robiniae]NUU42339.1 hypothetical protein [Tardiphaga robiniae]